MGAWGLGNWDNDDALDWIAELHDVSGVEAALSASVTHTGACCRALAAAEVVAACLGRGGADLPATARAWIARHRTECPEELARTAAHVVQIIGSKSELQALFDEAGRHGAWHAILDELAARLRGGDGGEQ